MRKTSQRASSASTEETGTPARKDGRRPLLVYLDPSLIKDLKKEAIDRDINVYELVGELLKGPRVRS